MTYQCPRRRGPALPGRRIARDSTKVPDFKVNMGQRLPVIAILTYESWSQVLISSVCATPASSGIGTAASSSLLGSLFS